MPILISELVSQNKLKLQNLKFINEYSFEYFSRISNEVIGKKCVFILDKKYVKKLDSSVVMVITTEEIYNEISNLENLGFCITDNPRGLYFKLLELHESSLKNESIETTIGCNCELSNTCVISKIGVSIGNNVKIGDNVIIRKNVIIGNDVTIQSGTVIGEDDFNIYSFENKQKQLIHNGKIIIGNNVLIGANCNIGQALYDYGKTIIEDNVQIGSLTCVGHNVVICDNCEICGGTVIGGYTRIGKKTFVGMHSVFKNALEIGEESSIGMGSVVVRNVKKGTKVFGNPAMVI